MAEAANLPGQPAPERKVLRKETFKLTDNDIFLLQSLSSQISLAQQSLSQAQNNVTGLLGVISIERWDFPRNADVRFTNFDLKDGKVTVEQLETLDDPKEEAGNGKSDSNVTKSKSGNKASAKTDVESDLKEVSGQAETELAQPAAGDHEA